MKCKEQKQMKWLFPVIMVLCLLVPLSEAQETDNPAPDSEAGIQPGYSERGMAGDPSPPGRMGRGPEHRRRMGGERMRGERRRQQKAREMMLSLKIWKLTEALKVDEDLSQKLYPRVRELEDLRFEQQKEYEQTTEALKLALEAEPRDGERIQQLVDLLKTMRVRHVRAEQEKVERICSLLTLEQQAEYFMVEAEFNENVRRFLRERQGRRQPDQP